MSEQGQSYNVTRRRLIRYEGNYSSPAYNTDAWAPNRWFVDIDLPADGPPDHLGKVSNLDIGAMNPDFTDTTGGTNTTTRTGQSGTIPRFPQG